MNAFLGALSISKHCLTSIYHGNVIMGAIASQITSLTIVYSTVYSDADQRKHQSSASLAFVRGIHRGLVNSPHKWPVTRKMFPFNDVIMRISIIVIRSHDLLSVIAEIPIHRKTVCSKTRSHTLLQRAVSIWGIMGLGTPRYHQAHWRTYGNYVDIRGISQRYKLRSVWSSWWSGVCHKNSNLS